jgi:Uncharacterized conserved protein
LIKANIDIFETSTLGECIISWGFLLGQSLRLTARYHARIKKIPFGYCVYFRYPLKLNYVHNVSVVGQNPCVSNEFCALSTAKGMILIMSQAPLKQRNNSLIVTVLVVVVILGVMVYLAWPYLSILNNPEQTRNLIIGAGAWGPVVYILLQVAQAFIAPIPGQVIGFVGGYLFGTSWGLVYTLIGAGIGFTLIFVLTRKLGRPFVELFIKKELLEKFDHLTEDKGVLVFFLIFLLPAFPDDMICFIAGLTRIKISTLVLISIAGRLPGYAILSYTGSRLVYENMHPVVVIVSALIMLLIIVWWNRLWLREFVEHNNRIQWVKEQWSGSWLKVTLWSFGIIIIAIFLYKALL